MSRFQKISLVLLRISMGWFFFYAGITKVLDPKWSAASTIKGATALPGFYNWLLDPNILPVINFMNEWGLTLLGISLIIGLFVRLSSILGALLMLLYYLAQLKFPYPNPHSFIVDQHIIYIFVLLYFAAVRAGKSWGLDGYFRRRLG